MSYPSYLIDHLDEAPDAQDVETQQGQDGRGRDGDFVGEGMGVFAGLAPDGMDVPAPAAGAFREADLAGRFDRGVASPAMIAVEASAFDKIAGIGEALEHVFQRERQKGDDAPGNMLKGGQVRIEERGFMR